MATPASRKLVERTVRFCEHLLCETNLHEEVEELEFGLYSLLLVLACGDSRNRIKQWSSVA